MKNLTEVPNAYQAIWSLDLQRNQKKALWLNLATLLVFAGMVVVAAFVVPLSFLLDLSCFFRADGITGTLAALWTSLGKLAVVVVGAVACLMLQALLGGLLGGWFSGVRPTCGFTGLVLYISNNACFAKRSYIGLLLLPTVVLGVLLLLANLWVPVSWFWVVYLIQACNLSNATVNVYVACKLCRLPADILVQDTGALTIAYAKAEQSQ